MVYETFVHNVAEFRLALSRPGMDRILTLSSCIMLVFLSITIPMHFFFLFLCFSFLLLLLAKDLMWYLLWVWYTSLPLLSSLYRYGRNGCILSSVNLYFQNKNWHIKTHDKWDRFLSSFLVRFSSVCVREPVFISIFGHIQTTLANFNFNFRESPP